VTHHETLGEVLPDGEAPEHRLGQHANGQRQRQPHEVAPERPAEEREHEREHSDHADQTGDGAVGVLDHGVRRKRRSAFP